MSAVPATPTKWQPKHFVLFQESAVARIAAVCLAGHQRDTEYALCKRRRTLPMLSRASAAARRTFGSESSSRQGEGGNLIAQRGNIRLQLLQFALDLTMNFQDVLLLRRRELAVLRRKFLRDFTFNQVGQGVRGGLDVPQTGGARAGWNP